MFPRLQGVKTPGFQASLAVNGYDNSFRKGAGFGCGLVFGLVAAAVLLIAVVVGLAIWMEGSKPQPTRFNQMTDAAGTLTRQYHVDGRTLVVEGVAYWRLALGER